MEELDYEDGDEDIEDYGVPVHVFEKNGWQQIHISINEYKGHEYIDIRMFYKKGEKYKPSKKGVTLRKDQYQELLNGIIMLGEALGFDVDESEEDQGTISPQ